LDRKSQIKHRIGPKIEHWTGNPKAAGSRPARGHFFAMHIFCSRCSDCSMWLPFW